MVNTHNDIETLCPSFGISTLDEANSQFEKSKTISSLPYKASRDEKFWTATDNVVESVSVDSGWAQLFRDAMRPLGPLRWPVVFTWIMASFIFLVFSGELLWSKQVSGEFLELDPFNIMIGPSLQILIQCGARFAPCMQNATEMHADQKYVCLNTTQNLRGQYDAPISLLDPALDIIPENLTCSLQEICGFGGFTNDRHPDQSFRFLTPLLVHSGLIHFVFNMMLLILLGRNLERMMNPMRFGALFLIAGIFGNVFGAAFAPTRTPSMGCNTALFGLLACFFVDFGLRWRTTQQPLRHIVKLIVFTALGSMTVLLPGVDSFSNIGGFLGGLLAGVSMVPAVHYSKVYSGIIWLLRILSFCLLVFLFIILLDAFYSGSSPDEICSFCRYIACLSINGYCDQ